MVGSVPTIAAEYATLPSTTVIADLAAGRHHVVVGHYVARGVDDDTRPLTGGSVAADHLDGYHRLGR